MAVFTKKLPEKETEIKLSSNQRTILAYPPPIPHRNPTEGTAMAKQSKHTHDPPGSLTDLCTVVIQGNTAQDRLTSFLAQVETPYQFCVGDTVIRISYREDGRPLHDVIRSHFMHLKQGDTLP